MDEPRRAEPGAEDSRGRKSVAGAPSADLPPSSLPAMALLPRVLLLSLPLLSALCVEDAGSTPSVRVANMSQPVELTLLRDLIEDRLQLLSSQMALAPAQKAEGGDAEELGRSIWDLIVGALKAILKALRLLQDPIPFGDYDLNLDSPSVSGHLSLKSVYARHLRDIVITKYFVNLFTMCTEVDLLLPQLSLSTRYDVDINVQLDEDSDDDDDDAFRVFGAGPAKIDMNNIKIHADICISFTHFSVKIVNLKLSVKSDEVSLRGLFGGGAISDMLSGIATDVVPDMVQEFQQEITEFVMDTINKFIKSKLPASDTTKPSL